MNVSRLLSIVRILAKPVPRKIKRAALPLALKLQNLILTYNRRKLLARNSPHIIDTLVKQTPSNVRLILIFTQSDPLINLGGTERYIWEFLHETKKIGNSVITIYPDIEYDALSNDDPIAAINMDFSY